MARRPGYYRDCGCHCFTEDEADNEGPGYRGWSEVEVHARATQVLESAVLYASHATIRRGYAYAAGQGHAWIAGVNGLVSRFVESEASKARVAHLVSGYRDTGVRSAMLLGSMPLHYFNGSAPTWWLHQTDVTWRNYPNNTSPDTSIGLAFWADVCASWCVRRFEDESEFMELDFTVLYGPANTGRCSCYAYQDTDQHSTHANKNSHAAPDDIRVRFCHAQTLLTTRAYRSAHRLCSQAMEFLHEFHKIPANQPNGTHIYAMKKAIGQGLWIPRLQSTLYYQRLWQAEVDASQGALDGAPALAGVRHLFYDVSSLNACFERCADEAVAAVRPLRTVRYDARDQLCRCFDISLFAWTFDSIENTTNALWETSRGSTAEWYEVKFCEFVRPDTVRALTRTLHTLPSDPLYSHTLRHRFSRAARPHPRLVQEPAAARAGRRLVLGLARGRRCVGYACTRTSELYNV